jgi:hypothetical protein
VIIIAGISQNVKAITLGIFFSLLISLLFLPLIVRLAVNYFWINIIAGGFIAQHAVVGILNDPVVSNWIYTINKSLPEANIVNIIANGTIIIFVVIGLYSYIKHHRIYR